MVSNQNKQLHDDEKEINAEEEELQEVEAGEQMHPLGEADLQVLMQKQKQLMPLKIFKMILLNKTATLKMSRPLPNVLRIGKVFIILSLQQVYMLQTASPSWRTRFEDY